MGVVPRLLVPRTPVLVRVLQHLGWPLWAATEHICSFHGHPFSCNHCSTSRWPFKAAAMHVSSSHGHLFLVRVLQHLQVASLRCLEHISSSTDTRSHVRISAPPGGLFGPPLSTYTRSTGTRLMPAYFSTSRWPFSPHTSTSTCPKDTRSHARISAPPGGLPPSTRARKLIPTDNRSHATTAAPPGGLLSLRPHTSSRSTGTRSHAPTATSQNLRGGLPKPPTQHLQVASLAASTHESHGHPFSCAYFSTSGGLPPYEPRSRTFSSPLQNPHVLPRPLQHLAPVPTRLQPSLRLLRRDRVLSFHGHPFLAPTAAPPGGLPLQRPSTFPRPKDTRSHAPTAAPPGGLPLQRPSTFPRPKAPVPTRPLQHLQVASLCSARAFPSSQGHPFLRKVVSAD